MPWSPVPLFPNVIAELKTMGYSKQTRAADLRLAVIRIIGATAEKTIRRDISLMIDLGWVVSFNGGITYEISQDGKPNNFLVKAPEPEPEPDVVPEEKAEEHLDALLPGSDG